jgi:hypothetical protein
MTPPAAEERALSVAPPLRRLLARVHEVLAPGSALQVRADELAAVEAELGSVVPDAVIAFLLARGRTLGLLVELTRERNAYAEATHGPAVAGDPRGRLVIVDSFGDWPRTSVGYRPTRERSEPMLVRWDWKKWVAWSAYPETIEVYLREHFAAGEPTAPASRPGVDLTVAPGDDALARFSPRIVAPLPAVERFVVHPKFGRGRVRRDLGDRLEIDFEDGGTRVLLARFVTPA